MNPGTYRLCNGVFLFWELCLIAKESKQGVTILSYMDKIKFKRSLWDLRFDHLFGQINITWVIFRSAKLYYKISYDQFQDCCQIVFILHFLIYKYWKNSFKVTPLVWRKIMLHHHQNFFGVYLTTDIYGTGLLSVVRTIVKTGSAINLTELEH